MILNASFSFKINTILLRGKTIYQLVQPFPGLLGGKLLLFPRVSPMVNAVYPLRGFYFPFIFNGKTLSPEAINSCNPV